MPLLWGHTGFSRPFPTLFRTLGIPLSRQRTFQPRISLQTRGNSNKPRPDIRNTLSSKPVARHRIIPPGSPHAKPVPGQASQQNEIRPAEEQFDPKVYFPEEKPANTDNEGLPIVKVRYLQPAVWAVGVSTGIYIFMSFLEARSQLKPVTPQPHYRQFSKSPPGPIELATGVWAQQYPVEKVAIGLIAANGAVHLSSFLTPRFWMLLWHMPAMRLNFTMFTSTFVHDGPIHLLVNMWATYNFLPSAGSSQLFEGNARHTLAFYLSTGVLTGLAGHLTLLFKKTNYLAYVRSGGASGALFAMFGVFCTQFPDAKVGILFVPVSFEAINFLPCVMAFDLYGMIRGYSFVNWGHAAHFSGALLGIGYSYLDGKNNLWNPLVRFWKRRLQKP